MSTLELRQERAPRTSSRRVGNILRVRNPSENLSSTLVKPFMKEIFSSRVFAAKLDRSRKFKVDTGNDEKKACRGRSDGVGRLCGCRVMSAFRSAIGSISNTVLFAKQTTDLSGLAPVVPCQ